ncbi:MAG: ATP-binding cassette domain-containing protein [Clostridiales bacterium]|jgi:D-methionine transport system ATP-binding protein|nr:ATP-binding cassette domain-containing protein [Clostridiales bacterium]
MLSVRNLSKTYKNGAERFQALKNVSVDIEGGEIFGFIGLSGAGKTSLARCISMLEQSDGGEILLDGVDMTKLTGQELRDKRKKLGLVFQHFNLLMNATVFDNIAFPLSIDKKSKPYIKDKVDGLLELVGLTDKRDSYPSKLSGGQKQRVGIARALAADPELVICDEATSSLDPETTRSILELIKRINTKTGVTFIVITHEMDVIKELCSRVAVMEDGEIIEQGPVIDVLTRPKTDTARRFFDKTGVYDTSAFIKEIKPGEIIVKATFIGDSALKPFISDVIRSFDVNLSILSGGIEPAGGTVVGALILKISGSDGALASSMQYFKENGVGIEVINNASL